MGKGGDYPRKRGRKGYDFSVRIYEWMLPTVMARLSGNQVKLLLYMMSFEKGGNNGAIPMSARHAAQGIDVTAKTALDCLHGLDKAGFIRPVELGFFAIKGGPATTWRLTFLPAFGKAPSHEWREPPAEQISWLQFLPKPVVKNTTAAKKLAKTVAEMTTEPDGKLPNPKIALVGKSTTQTVAIGRGSLGRAAGLVVDPMYSDDPSGDCAAIRHQVRSVWLGLGVSRRRALARSCGITPEELGSYVNGHLALPFPKEVALRAAAKLAA